MDKNTIRQVLIEQKEEAKRIFHERIIPREIVPHAQKIFRSNLIKVITGVRRCGKSTLAHYLLKDKKYGYVNFDDERLLGVEAADLNDFLEVLHEIEGDFEYLLLDEVQNVRGWELFANRLKRSGYNVIITGSNARLLSKELATHLTGRHFAVELYPFSFKEFLVFNNYISDNLNLYTTRQKVEIKRWLEKYLRYGGFPEVNKIEPKVQYLQELYDRIITRDIILRYNIKYTRDLKEIALFSISNFASKISYHKIRNIFEMKSVHTVKNYLNYMEEAYLLSQINAFSFKLKEQLKLPKKLYCIDTGIINAVIPKSTIDIGRSIENMVFLELKRRNREVYFYSQEGGEVDFLIREGGKINEMIQVSYSIEDKNTRKREINALLKASGELGCKNLNVITWDMESEEKVNQRRIKYIPLWKWLISN